MNISFMAPEETPLFAKRVEEDEEVAYIDIVEEIDNVEEYFHGEPEKKQELLDQLEDWYYAYMEWLDERGRR